MQDLYPKSFGKYLLTKRIAVGGMAEVFKAKLIGVKGFEKTLAIKRILPEYSTDEEFVSMFVDEARISSNLHHKNIVKCLNSGKSIINTTSRWSLLMVATSRICFFAF
jgi:serine/threonine protein kinase